MSRIITIACCLVMLFASSLYAQDTVCPEGYICTQSDSNSNVNSVTDSTTTVISPPPSAITPSINTSNSDLCTVGVAGAVQTQILGISAGTTFTEDNCMRLKNAKTLYDMGMKVAAVSTMCQDKQVFEAMMNAGTPCPKDGLIGDAARLAWEKEAKENPEKDRLIKDDTKSTLIGGGVVGGLLLLLLL